MVQKDPCLMVCVTRQQSSQRLIEQGAEMARQQGLGLVVMHVAKPGENLMGNPSEGQALSDLFEAAKRVGGQMEMVRSEDFISALVAQARNCNAVCILMGASRGGEDTLVRMREVLAQQLPEAVLQVYQG